MNENAKLSCPHCGADYGENHLVRFDFTRRRFALICTACKYENEIEIKKHDTRKAMNEAVEPWRKKQTR